ncbi:MAG: GNAT family N-acetyltransferase [Clostridia bacterium]|nr:GNAT family N-acetyltransferase [Clostridia bacterium]
MEKGLEMTCFQTFDWYKIINRHFMAEKKKAPFRSGTYVLLTDDNDAPLMIAPIQIVKKGFYFKGIGMMKGFYFIGRQGFSDYLNFIYDDFKDEYLREILKFVSKKYGMTYCRFENVSEKTSSYKSLNNNYGADRIDSLCMTLDLLDSFDDYKKKWSKNMRGGMNQAKNRAVKDGLSFDYIILDKIDKAMAQKLERIRQQRLVKKQAEVNNSLSFQAKIYSKCREMLVNTTSVPINVMEEIKNCWCLISKCGDEIAAFFYCVYKPENKTIYFLLAGVDLKYERYKPGLTQLVHFFETEIGNGKPQVEFFDLTRGNERYKYDLKADEHITSQFVFYM